jgi:hypothetical protein
MIVSRRFIVRVPAIETEPAEGIILSLISGNSNYPQFEYIVSRSLGVTGDVEQWQYDTDPAFGSPDQDFSIVITSGDSTAFGNTTSGRPAVPPGLTFFRVRLLRSVLPITSWSNAPSVVIA